MMKQLTVLSIILLMVTKLHSQPVALLPKNPHYLTYKGKPIVLITSAEHYGALLNLDFDYSKYLRNMKGEGMNYTRIFTGTYVEIPGSFGIKNNTLAPAAGRFLTPWKRTEEPGLFEGEKKSDLTQWNLDYFTRLKDFLSEAAKQDIIVEVTLFCSTYDDRYWKRHPFNPDNNVNDLGILARTNSTTLENAKLVELQKNFIRKIVTELNVFENLFYEIQNEPWADNGEKAMRILKTHDTQGGGWFKWSETATKASLDWQKMVAAEIIATEKRLPKKHLIAQNYCNFKHSLEMTDPNVSILNFHYAWPETVWMNYGWEKPVSFDESGFSGNSDTVYLRQAWQFILAGGAIFNNLDYSFYAGREDGTGSNIAPGGGSPGLRKQLSILAGFINSFDLKEMKPHFKVIYHSPGMEWQALADKGKQYAIFLSGKPSGWISPELPEGNFRYEFISPFTGEKLSEGKIKSKGDPVKINLPEFKEMIALKIIVN